MSREEKNAEPEPAKYSVTDRRHWVVEDLEEATDPQDRLPTYVEQLKLEVATKDERLKEYIAAYKNKTAENDEFRKRLERENEGRLDQIKANFFKKILPVLSNFKRAIQSAQSPDDFESFKQGVEMITAQMTQQLVENGVETISAKGRKYDPNTDEVLMTVATDDPDQEGLVVEELEPGYQFKGKLLQPAKVNVAKLKK